MDKEQKYLIELTKSFIYNEKPHLSSEIDYSKLFSYADAHNLLGVIYCTVNSAENKSIIPPELFSAVQEKFFNIIYISNLQMQIYEEIKAAFAAAEIRFVPFKGVVLREIYPFPESRIMGDIDVLIDYNNRIPAKEALKNAGFVCKDSNGPVWNYTKNSVLIEVHTSILNGKVGNSSSPEYFKNAVDKAEFNGFEGSLPDQYHFEYLIAHTAHHFWFFGAGIKLILDLAAMIKNKNINIQQAVDDLSSCGLGEFSKNILIVCFKWYEAGTDFKYDISKTESFLVSYGAFGTKGRNSAAVVARKDLEDGK
ncbi:MAG: nucleotidyltransferase family protein, partial [Clostridiales bacterium]|nr:nucleotidyltransferase family protein [Clostridiales bacterium]